MQGTNRGDASSRGTASPALDDGLVLISLPGVECGLPLRRVREILRMVALTPVPGAPEWLAGMLNLRGAAVPVIDLRRRLALSPAAVGLETPIVVVEGSTTAVGMIADGVSAVRMDLQSRPEPLAAAWGRDTPVAGIVRVDSRLIVVLDLDLIVTAAEELRLPESLPGA